MQGFTDLHVLRQELSQEEGPCGGISTFSFGQRKNHQESKLKVTRSERVCLVARAVTSRETLRQEKVKVRS